jgi:Domain of unknown function (DUF4158)
MTPYCAMKRPLISSALFLLSSDTLFDGEGHRMPGTFLTTAERERLSRFPEAVSPPDLMTYFALSHNDQAFIDPYRLCSRSLVKLLDLCLGRVRPME